MTFDELTLSSNGLGDDAVCMTVQMACGGGSAAVGSVMVSSTVDGDQYLPCVVVVAVAVVVVVCTWQGSQPCHMTTLVRQTW